MKSSQQLRTDMILLLLNTIDLKDETCRKNICKQHVFLSENTEGRGGEDERWDPNQPWLHWFGLKLIAAEKNKSVYPLCVSKHTVRKLQTVSLRAITKLTSTV